MEVSEDDDSERYIVRHRNTGRKFIMKKVSETISQNLIAVAMGERDVLIRCSKINSVVLLMDSFSERSSSYLIIECPTGENLKDVVLRQGKKFMKEAEVKKCMQ